MSAETIPFDDPRRYGIGPGRVFRYGTLQHGQRPAPRLATNRGHGHEIVATYFTEDGRVDECGCGALSVEDGPWRS